ncbi:unnamed protein product [Rotaria sordida]|uniref:Major facilitator superfamily associated domain-containing protein n=1 Tax=Rotaria sordida TaxID=392033 RepID=A0A815A7E6_9BILA|nr:unnamed protein product [Rotaria sordida]
MESPSMLIPTANVPRAISSPSLSFAHRFYILLKAHYFLFFSAFGILYPILNITLRNREHYFLFFSAFGILYPILNITLRNRGLSNIELSYINIIIPFIIFFTNPLIGFIADHSRRYILTFNFIVAINTIIYAIMFTLPTVKSRNIHADIYHNNQYGYSLNFCASQEVATQCASRSQCGCSYQAHCTLIDSLDNRYNNQMKTFVFTFSINSKDFSKEINYATHMSEPETCGIKYRVSIDQVIKQYIENRGFDLLPSNDISSELANCEITCSIAHYCHGSRYANQIGVILLYSLLFVIGNNLINNAIALGVSIGFASLDRPEIFGQQRVFGTLDFGISAFLASRVYQIFQTEFVYIIMFSITTIICIIVTSFIRIQPTKQQKPSTIHNENIVEEIQIDDLSRVKVKKTKKSRSQGALSELLSMLKKIDAIIFLSLAFAWGMSNAVLDPYIYLYIDELAPCQSHSIVGWMSLVSSLSELVAFFLAGRALNFFGTNLLSIAIFLAFSIRFSGYYFIRKPYYFILMETMHFFNYGILYVLMAQKADAIAPPGLSGTLQGVTLVTLFGLGRGIGLLAASFIYTFTQQPLLFLIFALFNLIAAVIYSLYFILHRQSSKKSIEQTNNTNNNTSDIIIQSDTQLNEEPLLTSSTKNKSDNQIDGS